MKRTKEIELDGRTVTVRELTVAEVRLWLKELDQLREGALDLVTEGIMADASLGDVARMTDLTPEELDGFTPSAIESVIAVCREINPHFFRLRDRLLEAARAMP
ncbi:MAG: hypothetical protein HQL57_09985 [Magnetococcales bacterium]|nr:hypothetical protein [Magnetococcales bacterium]